MIIALTAIFNIKRLSTNKATNQEMIIRLTPIIPIVSGFVLKFFPAIMLTTSFVMN